MRNPEYEGSDLISTIREAEQSSFSQGPTKKFAAQLFQGTIPAGPALTITTERGQSPVNMQALGGLTWHVQELVDQPTHQQVNLQSQQQQQSYGTSAGR